MAYPTTIAAGTHVEGSIQASEDIAVEGSVHGTIELSEMLIIAADGVVRGDIQARVAHIDGIVVGTIQATERILLGPTARVQATMTSPLLQMNDGAQFAGELNIGIEGEAPAPTTSRTTTSATTRRAPAPTAVLPARTTTTSRPATTRAMPATSAAPMRQTTAATTVTVVEEVETVEETATIQSQENSASPIEAESFETQPTETTNADAVTFQELEDDYTVKELREELRRRELPVTGTKSELIERLLEADSQPS